MFSSKAMSESELDKLFTTRSWTYRKEWEAFPKLFPVVEAQEWPPVVLHGFDDDSNNGVLYVNAFESCISVCNNYPFPLPLFIFLTHTHINITLDNGN